MNFRVSPTKLYKELSLCKKAMVAKPTLPILENYLFVLDGNVLTVTASDTENTIRTRVDVDVEGDGSTCRVCVAGGLLLGLLSTLKGDAVSFSAEEGGTMMHIDAGLNTYDVPCFDAADFPLVPEVDGGSAFKVDCAKLSALLGGVSYAMSKDTLRVAMTGTLFEIAGGVLTAVATDANVLATGSVALSGGEGEVSCIVPAKTINLVSGLLGEGDVALTVGERNIRFATERTEVIARIVDGRYPNYKAVIPKDNPLKAELDRAALMESLKRMLLFSDDNICTVAFRFASDGLKIQIENAGGKGNASDRVDCVLGRDFAIGFNPNKLMSVLGNMVCERVEMSFSEPSRAALIVPAGENPMNALGICMPCIL